MGELFRRYWLPVAISSEVGTRPVKLRILGEDLVLFRDLKGRPGLLYSRCMHRGTTLFYGHVEEEGTAGCSASTGPASISRASPIMVAAAIWHASPGIRWPSAMA
jgi:hypothetical protein